MYPATPGMVTNIQLAIYLHCSIRNYYYFPLLDFDCWTADGAQYALAAEIATSLGITVSRLLELHPTLPWRTATIAEKQEIVAQGLSNASFITLISVAEVHSTTPNSQTPERFFFRFFFVFF